MKSTVVQYNSLYSGPGIKLTGKTICSLEQREEVQDGRAEGPAAIGDGRQAPVSLTPDISERHILIF